MKWFSIEAGITPEELNFIEAWGLANYARYLLLKKIIAQENNIYSEVFSSTKFISQWKVLLQLSNKNYKVFFSSIEQLGVQNSMKSTFQHHIGFNNLFKNKDNTNSNMNTNTNTNTNIKEEEESIEIDNKLTNKGNSKMTFNPDNPKEHFKPIKKAYSLNSFALHDWLVEIGEVCDKQIMPESFREWAVDNTNKMLPTIYKQWASFVCYYTEGKGKDKKYPDWFKGWQMWVSK